MRITVGKKLYISFFAVLLLMLIVGSVNLNSLRLVNQRTEEIMGTSLARVAIIHQINYLTERVLSLNLKKIVEENSSTLKGKLESEEMKAIFAEIDQSLQKYKTMIELVEAQDTVQALLGEWEHFKAEQQQINQLSSQLGQSNDSQVDSLKLVELVRQSDATFNNIKQYLRYLVDIDNAAADEAAAGIQQTYFHQLRISLALMVLSLVVALVLAFWLTRHISQPVTVVSQSLRRIAEGDLTVPTITIRNKDELGSLVSSLNTMSANLKGILSRVQNASRYVASSADSLSANAEESKAAIEHMVSTNEQIAAISKESQSRTNELTGYIQHLTAEIERIATNSETVNRSANDVSQATVTGVQAMRGVLGQIEDVDRTVRDSAFIMKQLGQHSQKIGDIVDLIGEISAQTNLLALNAAIEAAQAGVYGRGFSVVAAEVRKLAEQSDDSARQIGNLLRTIQREIEDAVGAMERASQKMTESVHQVNGVADAFNVIDNSIRNVTEQITEVTQLITPLVDRSKQVLHSLDRLGSVAKEAAAGTEQNLAVSEEQLAAQEEILSRAQALQELADDLNSELQRFTL
ncbi:methyl-accepting chemotaxis protein [Brevibacillus marinus]|uniref:methyl-accepting chemotaxis protein n=1 Tax=Brevibacillus marinus TaxID=2496837 RepID=UPI000F8236C2|nr:HAMP domain-containing methyl-accepting chemotaxis protein [Brevibacillus marinus]